ncbi:MAG: hypothetical protein ACYSWO_22615 [Planctomycetota bacterium]|jgi:hypothetical protein
MSVERIVDRLIECVLGLYNRRWEPWEVLALGVAGLVVILTAIRMHRKATANAKHLRQRTPSGHLLKL